MLGRAALCRRLTLPPCRRDRCRSATRRAGAGSTTASSGTTRPGSSGRSSAMFSSPNGAGSGLVAAQRRLSLLTRFPPMLPPALHSPSAWRRLRLDARAVAIASRPSLHRGYISKKRNITFDMRRTVVYSPPMSLPLISTASSKGRSRADVGVGHLGRMAPFGAPGLQGCRTLRPAAGTVPRTNT